MNEFTPKNEQVFVDACGAIGVELNAMIEPHKERDLVSEFLKDPVSGLETELPVSLLHDVGRGPRKSPMVSIDFINEGGNKI
jgi:hypothetical protein